MLECTGGQSLSCPRGGFPSIRHNEIRDITATLMSEVCHNVKIEPGLQPVTGEQFDQLDIVAQRQSAFFDVRVFNPYAPCYRNSTQNKLEKKRCYEERIREIEHGSFTPLVLSAAGGIGPAATIVYKRLASLISEKQGSSTPHWVRCRLN